MSIRKARKLNYMTQKQLAEAVGVCLGSVRAWEQGVSKITEENLNKVAKVLECDKEFLLEEEGYV
jgi:transcriptional regulator with XRE-family HTH domain